MSTPSMSRNGKINGRADILSGAERSRRIPWSYPTDLSRDSSTSCSETRHADGYVVALVIAHDDA